MLKNKLFLFLFVSLFLVSFASASLFQSNQIFRHNQINSMQKHFLESNHIKHFKDYGTYDVYSNKWFGLLRGETTQSYTLLSSDNSIINAYAILEVKNYIPSKLLSKMSFSGGTPKDLNIFYWVNESYKKQKYRQVCSRDTISLNGTIQKNCHQKKNGFKIKYKAYWKKYNNQVFPPGTYKLKITAKLPHANKKVDWILHTGANDIALSNWLWWDASWVYKEQINFTANVGQFSYLETIPYSANMNSDFSDIRFVDTATETTEYNYTIESYTASTSAIVRIHSQGASSVMMYYGNSGATTTSSASDTYFNPVSYYYLDEDATDSVGTNDGTIGGATSTTGKIGTAYSFDGSTSYIEVPYNADLSSALGAGDSTVTAWVYLTSSATSTILSLKKDSTGHATIDLDVTSGYLRFIDDGAARVISSYSTLLPLNQWVFVSYRKDRTNTINYLGVNGVEESFTSSTGSTVGDNNPLEIGKLYASGNYWIGKIDEVAIYNKALTSTEISELYNQTAPTFTIGAEQITQGVSTTLNSPIDNYKSTSSNIIFNWTSKPVNVNLTNTTLYIWDNSGTLLNSTFYTLSGTTAITTTQTDTLSDGNYIWNAETCGEGVNCYFATNRTFSIDTILPTINVSYAPSGTFNYLYPNQTMSLNFTASDIHLDSCWYQYNQTNVSVPCVNGTLNNLTFIYQKDENSLIVYVNDTYGNLAYKIESWTTIFSQYDIEYDNNTLESSESTFTLTTQITNGDAISDAKFYYNNSNYTTQINLVNNLYKIVSTIVIPTVNNDTNFSFGFFITTGGVTYNIKNLTQYVTNINIFTCDNSSGLLMNLSLFDQKTREILNGTIEMNTQIKSTLSRNTIAEISHIFSNVTSGAICISPSSAFNNTYLDAEIRFYNSDHVPEFYYIQNASLSEYPTNINLFDLATVQSTEFLLAYKDESFIPVSGAIIQLQRKYVGDDIHELVEAPVTRSDGKAVVHVDLNTNKYKIIVVKNGKVLNVYPNLVFICDNALTGVCEQNLVGNINPQNSVPVTSLKDFSYSIQKENNSINVIYSIPSGTSQLVNVSISQTDSFGNKTTCDKSILSSSGEISCTYNDTIGESYLSLNVYKGNNLMIKNTYKVTSNIAGDFGGNNFIIVMIFMLSLVGMAIASPEFMIINAVVTMLIAGSLWLLSGVNFVIGIGSLAWLFVAAVILIFKLSKQEDI